MTSSSDVIRVYDTHVLVDTLLLYLDHMQDLSTYRT